jgi:hypothetical protein
MEEKNQDHSKDKIALGKQLQDISREKRVLSAILPYYSKVGTFDPTIGLTELEFKDYLVKKGFFQLREEYLKSIETKISERKKELENMSKKASKLKSQEEERETLEHLRTRADIKAESLEEKLIDPLSDLGSLKQILFIPSWNKLLDKEHFKGFYLNEPVLEILHDNIIILPDFAVTGFEETKREPFIFLCGPGIYYTHFRLRPGEIISDYKEIIGIVLPMDVYDKAQDLSRSMVRTEDLLMTEYMVSIPFSLMLAETTKQMFIRGVVARNVFHPFKECFTKFLETCENPNSFNEEEGLKVLCGGLSSEIPLYANELLTEKVISKDYSRLTAGIKNIQPKLDKILSDLAIDGLKKPIFEQVKLIKEDFVNIGYPRLLDWMP